MRATLSAAVCTAAFYTASVARAQMTAAATVDSLPARAGTWAIEGGVSAGDPTFGLLRFLSPRTALGLQLRGGVGSDHQDSYGGFGFGDSHYATADLTFGLRHYTPVRDGLSAFVGGGAVGHYDRASSGNSSQRNAGLGGRAELGAAYVIARRLSVNASTSALALHRSGRARNTVATSPNTTQVVVAHSNGWYATGGGVGLSATLFF